MLSYDSNDDVTTRQCCAIYTMTRNNHPVIHADVQNVALIPRSVFRTSVDCSDNDVRHVDEIDSKPNTVVYFPSYQPHTDEGETTMKMGPNRI
jgi:hypothetical protein